MHGIAPLGSSTVAGWPPPAAAGPGPGGLRSGGRARMCALLCTRETLDHHWTAQIMETGTTYYSFLSARPVVDLEANGMMGLWVSGPPN